MSKTWNQNIKVLERITMNDNQEVELYNMNPKIILSKIF